MRFGPFPADTKELIADGKEVKLFKVGENIFGYINGQNKPETSINIFCRM